MTQQKFIAGYNLDEVFAQEEARLKAEREAAARQKREDELRQKLDARKPKAKPPVVTPPVIVPLSSSVVPYHGIEFEQRAYHAVVPMDKDKVLLSYEASLARLRAAGFERHARPQEVFGLLADGLEGKLAPQEKIIHDDMLASYGEWLSLAFERRGDTLVTYLDPERLEWKRDKYVKTRGFKHAEKRDFDISGKRPHVLIDLNLFNDDLVQFLYGRSFTALPQEMREGEKRAQLYLPEDRIVSPVGRGDVGGYGIFCYNYSGKASRGVRSSSTPKK